MNHYPRSILCKLDHFEFLAVWFRAANEKVADMRIWCVLLVAVTSLVSGDPDLRQLLHIWRPTPALTWSHVTPELLDATGQIGSQYLQGSDFWFGSRPQCEQVNNDVVPSATSNESYSYPVAVYRVLKLKVNVSEPLVAPQLVDQTVWFKQRYLYLGVCVPGACGDAAQVSGLLRQMLHSAKSESNFRDVQLVKVKILPSDFSVWGDISTSLLIILCILAAGLAILGTIVDLRGPKSIDENKSVLRSMAMAFSVPRNAHNLFKVSSNSQETFLAIHGIKVLTMTWIIFGHLCMYVFAYGANPAFRYIAAQIFLLEIIVNGTISVDTFFFITGFLLTYIVLKNKSAAKSNSFLQGICKFIVLVLQRVLRYRRTAMTAGILMMVAACFTNAFLAYNVIETYPKMSQIEGLFMHIFAKPWFHLGAVWLGMVVGWIVHRGIAFNVGKVGMVVGWTLCLCGTSIPLFTEKYKDSSTSTVTAVYLALKSTIWGASLAWILLFCIHKRSNFVRKFLELPIFIPLSRATYCTYLIHIPILECVFMNLDGPTIINRGFTFVLTIGFVAVSFATGIVMSLTFESPVIRLLALLRKPHEEKYQPAIAGPEIELENHRNVRAEL
ncbi:hypothetical protein B566_EDAN013937 [Ephemera danica]|nr:hypothetical protein B566_EDAN013937 [Ephemera danica]